MARIQVKNIESPLNSTKFQKNINDNFKAVSDELDAGLSRVASDQPNQMQTQLDMNSYRIINVADGVNETDGANIKQIKVALDSGTYAKASADAAKASADDAEASAAEAGDYSELSKKWAIADDGTPELEGERSSKGSAVLSYAYATTPHGTPVDEIDIENVVLIKGVKGDTGEKGDKGDTGSPVVIELNGTSYHESDGVISLPDVPELVDGKVPASNLPSYVDDVVEYANTGAFPAEGEAGKIYVATNTNKTYRWTGSIYVEISASIALGETSETAYRGDMGKVAYDHSQETGNPHETTAAQVGAYTQEQVDTALGNKADNSALDAHTQDDENPHDTTAAQVGAPTITEMNTALSGKLGNSGTQTLDGALSIVGTPIAIFSIKNTDATQYSRMLFDGNVNDWTSGVGNSAATIEDLRNKYYVYDFTNSKIAYTITPDTLAAKFYGPLEATNLSGENTGDQDLSNLVVKETGKGLSTNDYTDADKERLDDTSGENTGDQDLSGLLPKSGGAMTGVLTYASPQVLNMQPVDAEPDAVDMVEGCIYFVAEAV